ncbi:hypothetical protein J6590_002758 [Homalodisca vitripennis]|nr:hypothetical protein J6590_002758 [Homalodisca vitripennis]
MAGQTGRLQGQDRSAVTCPSSSHARRCLICAIPLPLRNCTGTMTPRGRAGVPPRLRDWPDTDRCEVMLGGPAGLPAKTRDQLIMAHTCRCQSRVRSPLNLSTDN